MSELRPRPRFGSLPGKSIEELDFLTASDRERYSGVKRIGYDVEDALRAGRGPAAGLLDHEGQRMTLVEHAQLARRRLPERTVRGIHVDAAFEQEAVNVADERSRVSRRVRPARRLVVLFQVV